MTARNSGRSSSKRKERPIMKILLKNAVLLDAAHEYEPVSILIDGERIAAVDKDIPAEDVLVMDMGGRTVMPAFLDAHVHTKPLPGPCSNEEPILQAFVYNGLSGAKDLGILDVWPLEDYLAWLRSQDEPGKLRVATAGRYIDVDGGYGMGPFPDQKWGIEIVTPEEAADMVRHQFRAGVNGIKIGINDGVMSPIRGQLSAAHVRAITDAAHELGLWTSAHVYRTDDLRMLVENGIDEAAHTPHDRLMDDDLIAAMVEKRIPMTTTIGDLTEDSPPPRHCPPQFTPEEFLALRLRDKAITLKNLRKFYEAGGTICVGTDFMHAEDPIKEAVIPVGELRQLRRDIGMSMREVICAGTVNAAASCGFSDEGAIRPGNRANIIAFDGPLDDDFSQLLDLKFVIHRGAVIRDQRNG